MRVRTTEVYRDWINDLKDRAGRARIEVGVDRLAHGNPGKHRYLRSGVAELKIDFGPGLDTASTRPRGTVSSSCFWRGGDKSSQKRDIDMAAVLAKNL